MRKTGLIILLSLCLLVPARARDTASGGQDATLAGRHTTYWAPADADSGKHPLILFSHGFTGCSTQITYLTAALAADGYWVFAPDHDDASCKHGEGTGGFHRPEERFGAASKWDDQVYVKRRDDMTNLLKALREDPQFKDRIDFSKVGLMGHSLGGYTVMALAGAWPSWKMDGIKAVLALSPYCAPFVDKNTVGDIDIPIMYQGGTRDIGITPGIKKSGGCYDLAHAPKYFIEFSRASHFAWTDMNHSNRDSIIAYSVAFLDHYVKGAAATPALTAARNDVTDMRYDSDVGKSDSITGDSSGETSRPRLGSRLRQRLRGSDGQ